MKTLLALLMAFAATAHAQITVAAPTASPGAGTYSGNRYVKLSTSTTGVANGQPNAPYSAIIPWSLTGTPTYLSTHYSTPVGVLTSGTLKAWALIPILNDSAVTGSCAPTTGVNCGESQTATQSSTSPWPRWKAVCDNTSSCGGGTVIPASTTHEIVTILPGSVATLSGSATHFALTTNATAGGNNVLWTYEPSPNNEANCTNYQCTYFYQDYWVYFPSSNGTHLDQWENDMNNFDDVTGLENTHGTQCNFKSGFWQFANQGGKTGTGWQTSAVPCNDGRHSGTVNMPQNSWIHIQKGNHLTQTGCVNNSKTVPSPSGSDPCLVFDYLAINGTVYANWGKTISTQTGASFNLPGPQFQMNATCASCTADAYLDKAVYIAGQISPTSSIAYTINPLTSALPMTVTGSTPTLLSTYLSAPGSPSSLTVGQTLQFSLFCHYSSGPDQNCTSTDEYGNGATAFTSTSTAAATIENVGAANPGLATAIAAGSTNITGIANGPVMSPAYPLTINPVVVNLTGVSLATTGGVTALMVGSTNQLVATCLYSDSSTTNCTSTDSHGNKAGSYLSATPGHATVNSTTGLATGVAAGSTTFTAQAGTFTSSAIPLTVIAIPSGTYTITITGPVSFKGTVTF